MKQFKTLCQIIMLVKYICRMIIVVHCIIISYPLFIFDISSLLDETFCPKNKILKNSFTIKRHFSYTILRFLYRLKRNFPQEIPFWYDLNKPSLDVTNLWEILNSNTRTTCLTCISVWTTCILYRTYNFCSIFKKFYTIFIITCGMIIHCFEFCSMGYTS